MRWGPPWLRREGLLEDLLVIFVFVVLLFHVGARLQAAWRETPLGRAAETERRVRDLERRVRALERR